MAEMRQWIGTVLMITVLIVFAHGLVPKGSLSDVVSFAGGLILLWSALSPLTRVKFQVQRIEDWAALVQKQQEALEGNENRMLAACIADATEAYILNQAKSLHVEVSAEVATEQGPEGIPVPYGVTLCGAYSSALSDRIQEDLGIPAERQVWNETEN